VAHSLDRAASPVPLIAMPVVSFDSRPDSARVWIFGSD
jgi:hypothetical protein